MKLSIIIVNWNTEDLLKQTLDSVFKETKNFDFEVIVVDNNSMKDDSVKIAKGEYLMLLNSDVIVLNQAIEKLVGFLDKHPETHMAGPKLLNKDMTFQHACRRGVPDPLNSLFYLTGLYKIFKNAKIDSYKKFNVSE